MHPNPPAVNIRRNDARLQSPTSRLAWDLPASCLQIPGIACLRFACELPAICLRFACELQGGMPAICLCYMFPAPPCPKAHPQQQLSPIAAETFRKTDLMSLHPCPQGRAAPLAVSSKLEHAIPGPPHRVARRNQQAGAALS